MTSQFKDPLDLQAPPRSGEGVWGAHPDPQKAKQFHPFAKKGQIKYSGSGLMVHDLHPGVGVIAMYHGVDDCFEVNIGQKRYGTKLYKIRRFK